MAQLKLSGSREKVAFIMDNIPQTRHNYLYLMLSYWQLFDEIDIPEDVIKQIVDRGTQPETIARSKRKAHEIARYREMLELQRPSNDSQDVESPHTI